MEAIMPAEYVLPSLRIAIEEKFGIEESLRKRLIALEKMSPLRKLKMRWHSPYNITWVLSNGAFTLSTLDAIELPKPINDFCLKPYFGPLPRKSLSNNGMQVEAPIVNLVSVALMIILIGGTTLTCEKVKRPFHGQNDKIKKGVTWRDVLM